MNINKIKPERKLRYLSEYMAVFIELWPDKPKPFESWLQSTLDKKENKGRHMKNEYQRNVCRYCRREFDNYNIGKTKDHIVPVSRGGLNKKENRVPCCYDCNQWKQDKSLIDWEEELFKVLKKGKIKPPYDKNRIGLMLGNVRMVIKEIADKNEQVSIYKVRKK